MSLLGWDARRMGWVMKVESKKCVFPVFLPLLIVSETDSWPAWMWLCGSIHDLALSLSDI